MRTAGKERRKYGGTLALVLAFCAAVALGDAGDAQAQALCGPGNTITADVVVMDNPTVFNRLGAQNPNWITYALRRDVVQNADSAALAANPALQATQGLPEAAGGVLAPGQVALRPDKRTRPLVVRSIAGGCLTVNFQNLLAPVANPNNAQQDALINDDQVAGRCAGFHASGTELLNAPNETGTAIGNDGSLVGNNHPAAVVTGNCGVNQRYGSLVGPGARITYRLYTPKEGSYLINSYGATVGSEQNSGNLGMGMFAALNVEPVGSRIYRGQVTEEELRLATVGLVPSDCGEGEASGVDCNPGGQPVIDYEAVYPDNEPWISEGKAGLPVLNMLTADRRLVHSDINAIVAGPNQDGSFPPSTYPLESVGKNVPSLPNRLEPFREFTSVFHDEVANTQVFPRWYLNPVMKYTLVGVKDAFMINYGSGGIGSEIIASRLLTGPMHDCSNCAYEEFFLASQAVGDPALLVNFPANTGIEQCDPANILSPACWRQFEVDVTPDDGVANPIAIGANPPIPGNYALFQEDPSNVHHSYTGDFVKIRNTHAGAFEQHIFHLHNHQWLFNPNDDNGNYLDAQEIMPGSGHTYELVNGGAGNRNKTAGDAIFHCHFYPHFAQGMWYHIRVQDVFERGTVLAVSNAADPQDPPLFDPSDPQANFHTAAFALRSGKPAIGARALPDGELPDGVPIPALVPLPGKPMPQMPARVSVVAVDRGDFGVLSGRRPPNGLGQGPDSAQAVVDRTSVAGPDGVLLDDPATPENEAADNRNPGFPFWLAGNECGVPTATNPCPQGIVGQRPLTPPLDMLTEEGATANGYNPNHAGGWDGGLPRHALLGYTAGAVTLNTQNRLDFRKIIEVAQPVYYPEIGTDLEHVSMNYHAVRNRPTTAQDLSVAGGAFTTGVSFVMNGAAPVPGAPFQDPCIDDQGDPLVAGTAGDWLDGDGDPASLNTKGVSDFDSAHPRTYRLANIQIDAVFNKVGYHYPQERIISLWGDVAATIEKLKPPEPLVMRFNSFDCGRILHANLVPVEFQLDDFQVRTPTDIIGQHIHLPKWDLTTNDGAANGWNYEDGTLSPGAVEERIHAINNFNALAGTAPLLTDLLAELGITVQPDLAAAVAGHVVDLTDLAAVPTIDTGDPGSEVTPGLTHLEALPHPFFGAGVGGEYLGARTTIQRILIDPLVNVAGVDRGLGLTFSHDHYGPSTFQQIGLYSTILAEPAGSTWRHNETGELLGGREVTGPGGMTTLDGGPTSWQAAILPPETAVGTVQSHLIPDHREFYFEMSDFQHAYEAGVYVGADAFGRPIETVVDQPNYFNATVAFAPEIQATWQQAVNPPLKLKENGGFPDVVAANGGCPGPAGNNDPNVPRPCAEAINISHSSMFVVNYRNEPVGLRVFNPNKRGPDGQNGGQAAGLAGDLAFAFQSRTDRAIPQLNTSFGDTPAGWQIADYCQGGDGDLINCDRNPGDPFTPIMRTYERDEVKVKIQTGATEEQHQASIHGMKWLANGSGFGASPNSGWRNFQSSGISEQFSLQTPVNPDPRQRGNTVDYLYGTDVTRDGVWTGSWGLLRSYGQPRQDLWELPENPMAPSQVVNQPQFAGVCPDANRDGRGDNLLLHDVTAVLANDVLPNGLAVTIAPNTQIVDPGTGEVLGGDSDNDGIGDNAGGPLNTLGGTLVYNRRGTVVPTITVLPEPGEPGAPVVFPGGAGPLNDPTAMLYVRTADLVAVNPAATVCSLNPLVNPNAVDTNGDGIKDRVVDPATGNQATSALQLPGCPVRLAANAPVEPLVLRARAGACIQVTLRNRLPAVAPDLAGWQDAMWVVKRRIQDRGTPDNPIDDQMLFFNNNLVRPSSYVGLHAQLVEYDASRDDGLVVGGNNEAALAPPGGAKISTFYAGDLRHEFTGLRGTVRQFQIVARPVEYGATNLLSADRFKQPQKGLFGGLVIEPANATWPDTLGQLAGAGTIQRVPDGQGTGAATRLTRAQVRITSTVGAAGSGGNYREALAMGFKIANLRWADGTAILNVNQGELGREGAEDSGHAGFNYGMEPSWFRFKLPPNVPFGNAGAANSYGSIPNVHAFYANRLVTAEPNVIPAIAGVSVAGDPQTPVFRSTADTARTNPVTDTRMHVLNGASADRDGAFILHGHVWQRDPFVCTSPATGTTTNPDSRQDDQVGLVGRCDPDALVPSNALGLNPQAKYMGGQQGMGHVFGYWPVLFDAGGTDRVKGDYLYRDYGPNGNRNGQFGLLRVQ